MCVSRRANTFTALDDSVKGQEVFMEYFHRYFVTSTENQRHPPDRFPGLRQQNNEEKTRKSSGTFDVEKYSLQGLLTVVKLHEKRRRRRR